MTKRRIFELDLLRGIFIVIILVDHLQFWPSPYAYISGEGRLWTSAAEGFFLISGLLIGYIRAYKGTRHPLRLLTKKLLSRAAMLYIWGVGITVVLLLFTLSIGSSELLPKLPPEALLNSPIALIGAIIGGEYFNDWIYFLRLYAIMLFVTPAFLWAIRKGYYLAVILTILLLYALSFVHPEAALQWQVYFFGAALIGYRLEAIAAWLRQHLLVKHIMSGVIISLTLITMVVSYYFVHGWELVESGRWFMDRDTYVAIRGVIDPWFSTDPVTPARIGLSFLWFSGLLLILHYLKPYIMRYLGWLLLPLGERSLTAYILQSLLLAVIVVTVPVSPSPLINFLTTTVVILLVWILLQMKLIRKLIPQ